MILIKGLSLSLDSQKILDSINLKVEKGTTLGIMGPTGCGKTTLLKAIIGLIKPTEGEIWIFGQDITKLSENQLNQIRRKMGMVFQFSALFDSLTVEENVGFGLKQHTRLSEAQVKEIVADKLRLVGLELEGIGSLLPAQLSGGMQKRVGIARALALEPEIVLYDEPTSGLDPVTAAAIDELIIELKRKLAVTSIVVSHDVASIFRVSDSVAMLYDGKTIAWGSKEEISNSQDERVRQFIEGRAYKIW